MAEPQDQQVTSKTPIAQADPPPAQVTNTLSETTKNVLTTTQWLGVISIIVSLAWYNKVKR